VMLLIEKIEEALANLCGGHGRLLGR